MFCLKVTYLTGRSYAAPPEEGDEKRSAEWPPHPGRLFCALVAAWGESGEPECGRNALQWLEECGCPAVVFSDETRRDVLAVYVPANDVELPRKVGEGSISETQQRDLMQFLPETRLRNDRKFPSASLLDPTVWFVWAGLDIPDGLRVPLKALLRCTTALGHSSSLVSVEIADPPEIGSLPAGFQCVEPADDGSMRLRVPSKGRLEYLKAQYEKFKVRAVKTNRPSPGATALYRFTTNREKCSPPQGVFREFLPLRRAGGSQLGLGSTHQLITAFRGAVFKAAGDDAPESLSGHAPGSTRENPIRSEKPHVAFVPLANVGFEHGDGRLLGVGVLLPALTSDEEQVTLKAIGSVAHLKMASAGTWDIEPAGATERRQALNPSRWTQPSRQWATVTPFVFDRFPKDHHGEEAQEIVRRACENIGLPSPTSVFCVEVQQMRGVPPSRVFKPAPTRPGKPQRWHIHLLLEWSEPVAGPICIGAGRYYGYGFCVPFNKG